jgi:hypothetical protein
MQVLEITPGGYQINHLFNNEVLRSQADEIAAYWA